jgi:hypothetical protein
MLRQCKVGHPEDTNCMFSTTPSGRFHADADAGTEHTKQRDASVADLTTPITMHVFFVTMLP